MGFDKFKVLIEMPKGETRRIHLGYSRTNYINLGPIKKVIPINNGIMHIAYGFVIGTLIKEDNEVDELDALVYSQKHFKIGQIITASPIASIRIKNNDHKVVFIDESVDIKEWNEIPQNERAMILEYFGYKSPIKKVGNKMDAIKLIKSSITKKPLPIPKKVVIVTDKIGKKT